MVTRTGTSINRRSCVSSPPCSSSSSSLSSSVVLALLLLQLTAQCSDAFQLKTVALQPAISAPASPWSSPSRSSSFPSSSPTLSSLRASSHDAPSQSINHPINHPINNNINNKSQRRNDSRLHAEPRGRPMRLSVIDAEVVDEYQLQQQLQQQQKRRKSMTGGFLTKFSNSLRHRWHLLEEAKREGYDANLIKTCLAAGEYDRPTVQGKVIDHITSAPCVMFTFPKSPSCRAALEAFETMGVQVKVVPFEEDGDPMRAEIGKRVKRSSVPMIFIKGNYVGGYDGGPSDEAPGLLTLAFQGALWPMLERAGANRLPRE